MQNIILSENVPLIIDIDVLKSHLRIAHNHEDEYLKTIIKMATDIIENHTEISLVAKNYQFMYYPNIADKVCRIKLPIRNVTKITEIVQNDKPVDYELQQRTNEILFIPYYPNSLITINYQAGISTDTRYIPNELKLAVLQTVKNIYDCSEENIMQSDYIKSIVQRYRCLEL